MPVLAGESENAEDDLSCSPGVIIRGSTWHMYYVVANRRSPMTLYIYHAVSTAPGIQWTKLGRIGGPVQPMMGNIETPSLVLEGDKVVLYFVGNGSLNRMESQDGHSFTNPVVVHAPGGATHGSVSFANGKYYYAFSKDPAGVYHPPTRLYLATSSDGLHFLEPLDLTPYLNPADAIQEIGLQFPELNVNESEFRNYYRSLNSRELPDRADEIYNDFTPVQFANPARESNRIIDQLLYVRNQALLRAIQVSAEQFPRTMVVYGPLLNKNR